MVYSTQQSNDLCRVILVKFGLRARLARFTKKVNP